MWSEKGWDHKSGIHKRAVAQVFSKFLYTGNDETGNTGTVEIMEKRIMGKLKEEEIMCKVISVVNPVSYTHLDVYKRQVLKKRLFL